MTPNEDMKLRDEIYAEKALEQIKARSPLLRELRYPKPTLSERVIPIVLGVLIIYFSLMVFPDNMDATLLVAFLTMLTFTTASTQANMANRRIKALIELIGEDALLKSATPDPRTGPKGVRAPAS